MGLNSGTDAHAIDDGHGPDWKQGQYSVLCTTFIIQKNLGTFGEGGAVVNNREDIDATSRKLRNHGLAVRSVHSRGYNSRLDDLHAAILSVKLGHITQRTDRRREIAARYTKGSRTPVSNSPTSGPATGTSNTSTWSRRPAETAWRNTCSSRAST